MLSLYHKKTRRGNFSDTETEVLVGEVEVSHSSVVENKRKCCEWQHVAAVVNVMSSSTREVPEI